MKQPPVIVVQLIHIEGPLKGEIQEFSLPEILIGRHADCQVRFPKDLAIVSRQHARIVREGNRFMVMDQSTNGTFVNGKPVKEAILKDGDVLLFAESGPKVSFLTQLSENTTEATDVAPSVLSSPAVETPESRQEDAPRPAPARPEPPPAEPEPSPEAVVPPVRPVDPAPASPSSAPLSQPVISEPVQQGEVPVQQVKKPLVVQYGPTLQSYGMLPVVIGSGLQSDFRLEHPEVFERHAQIFYYQGHYWIKDLTGKNLIRINDTPVVGQGMLVLNDRLSLSERGPDFKFLGGGRLAEMESVVPADPVDGASQTGSADEQRNPSGKGGMQIGAMMKKILKR